MTPYKKPKKFSFTINVSDPSLKDVIKLVTGIGALITLLMGYFHYDTKAGQSEIKISQDSVSVTLKDTTKTPRGQLSAKIQKVLDNDSAILLALQKLSSNDSLIKDHLDNLTRADAQISRESISRHERDSERIDLAFHVMANLAHR